MQADSLSLTFSALGDPTRRAILQQLSEGEASVGELTEPFDISMPAISRHLKVLERAGLVQRTRNAQWRPVQLNAAPLAEIANWVESYRKHWEGAFDRMDDYLAELQKGDSDAEN
ncbi:ArsR/SmtB family transcription factor [Algicella marina]|uniref:Metalloregulator ArsR/SmtB family transcription factor n=1 Tax=Algicella marina TaxID=2683284 RepID=A0A6P1SY96_9RHOB|nr:metalloregulator ArsR/SmtB family transcription factor [Algicella marina]QHQ35448.1 metalloregulator ArsR/SmtB family transcription factor [Algicella marina]